MTPGYPPFAWLPEVADYGRELDRRAAEQIARERHRIYNLPGEAPDCPRCGAADPRPNGSHGGRAQWRCRNCGRSYLSEEYK